MHNPTAITFTLEAQAAANGVAGFKMPKAGTLVGVSLMAEALTGSPTNVAIDVNGGAAGSTELIAAAVTLTAAGYGEYLCKHLGGTNSNQALADGDLINVDVVFSGGTSPTVDCTIVLWILMGQA
jgi:hypothetical protein